MLSAKYVATSLILCASLLAACEKASSEKADTKGRRWRVVGDGSSSDQTVKAVRLEGGLKAALEKRLPTMKRSEYEGAYLVVGGAPYAGTKGLIPYVQCGVRHDESVDSRPILEACEAYVKEGLPGVEELVEAAPASAASAEVTFCGRRWPADSKQIECSVDAVLDLSPLLELKSLEKLYVEKCRFETLDPITRLTNLKALALSGTNLTDVSALAGLPRLEELSLKDNPVTDLRPLANLKHLQSLILSGTKVADLSPLYSLSSLRVLQLHQAPADAQQVAALKKALPQLKTFGAAR